MRPRTKPVPGNHDLLMQTLMNVVGVLIVLLALMQLKAKDAVSQMATTPDSATLEQLASLEKSVVDTQANIAKRKEEVQAVEGTVAETRARLEATRAEIVSLSSSVPPPLPGDDGQLQVRRAKIEEQHKLAESLKATKTELDAKKGELEASIKAAPPKAEQRPPLSINPPNPRPALARTVPYDFVCRHGRIVPLNEEALRKNAVNRMKRAANELDREGGIDCEALRSLFEKEDFGNAYFRLKVAAEGTKLKLLIEHKENVGDTAQTVGNSDSLFQTRLKEIDSTRQYLRFRVYPDSFEVYLAAREALGSRMAAGWQPELDTVPHILDLKHELNCVGSMEQVETLKPTPDALPNAPPKKKIRAFKSDAPEGDASKPGDPSNKKSKDDTKKGPTIIIKLPDEITKGQPEATPASPNTPAAPGAPKASSRPPAPNDDID